MLSEAEAFESEIALIELFGRKDNGTGCLRNLTNGGEGVAGHRHSIRARNRIVKARRGRTPAKGHHWQWTEKQRDSMRQKLNIKNIEDRVRLQILHRVMDGTEKFELLTTYYKKLTK